VDTAVDKLVNWSVNNLGVSDWSSNDGFSIEVGSVGVSVSSSNKSVVLADFTLEVSGQWNMAWVWNGVVDVLDGSLGQRALESVLVLLNNVQSGF